jgi:hypothetical protein
MVTFSQPFGLILPRDCETVDSPSAALRLIVWMPERRMAEANFKALTWRCALCACAIVWPTLGHSQTPNRDIPPNAHYSNSEQGWTCNAGFRQVAGFCAGDTYGTTGETAFEVFDGQWRCRSGYHRVDSFCVPVTAPAHASFVGNSNRWECDWGFRKTASRCEEINPPPHAYIEASGREWVCFPGYERSSGRCIPAPGLAPAGEGASTGGDEERAGANSPPRADALP